MTEDQEEFAIECLRGALELLSKQKESKFAINLLELRQSANGGGSGHCLMDEIQDILDELDEK